MVDGDAYDFGSCFGTSTDSVVCGWFIVIMNDVGEMENEEVDCSGRCRRDFADCFFSGSPFL